MTTYREQLHITESLSALQERGDRFTRRLLQEKQRVARLEASLKEVTNEIQETRCQNKKQAIGLLNKHTTTSKDAYQRVDGINPTRLAEANQKKLLSNLECRLEKALVRQSGIDTENNKIKDKIDKLRRKVTVDFENRKVMEKKIIQIQKDSDEIMRRATIATENRDKILAMHNQLIIENDNERDQFHQRYAELSEYIYEQNQLLESSIAKVANDVVHKLERAEISEGAAGEGEDLSPVQEVKALDERILELEKQIAVHRDTLSQEEEKNKLLSEQFEKLKQVTGLNIAEEIIKAFVQEEEESFSMFNYIQTINQECDDLIEERKSVEEEIKSYKEKADRKEIDRKSIVDSNNRQLVNVRDEKEKVYEAVKERKMTILKISNSIQGLYVKLKCRQLDTIGGDQIQQATSRGGVDRKITMFAGEQISEKNILHHLELIEQRAIQIITEYAKTLDEKKKYQRRPSVLLSPKSFDRSFTTTRTSTSRGSYVGSVDNSDEESGDGRPVSVHDIRRAEAEKLKRPPSRQNSIGDFF